MSIHRKIFSDLRIDHMRVVGCEGKNSADNTPFVREPIYADEQMCLARLEERPGLGDAECIFNLSEVKVNRNKPLPGMATHLGTWPAKADFVVVGVGEMESSLLATIRSHPLTVQPEIEIFLNWVAHDGPKIQVLAAQKVDDCFYWYTSRGNANWLITMIDDAVTFQLRALLNYVKRSGYPRMAMEYIEQLSQLLLRSARSCRSIVLALEVLYQSGKTMDFVHMFWHGMHEQFTTAEKQDALNYTRFMIGENPRLELDDLYYTKEL